MFFWDTVGGLMNATCGNATELIIAIFALNHDNIALVKYSLLGSVISNLLLVLGTSLLCGGLVNLRQEQKYDRVRPYNPFKTFTHELPSFECFAMLLAETGRCELAYAVCGIALPLAANAVPLCRCLRRCQCRIISAVVKSC